MIDQELFKVFLDEFDELFKIAENNLRELSNQFSDSTAFELFRSFHMWKGNAAMLGYDKFVILTQEYCEFLRPYQNKTLNKIQISIIKECLVVIQKFRQNFSSGKNGNDIDISGILDHITD